MKRIVVTLVMIAAVITLTSPAMAQNSVTCSFLGQISEMVNGALNGVIANNCSAPPANTPAVQAGTNSAVVATPEPLAILAVGLGLLGARMLRRR